MGPSRSDFPKKPGTNLSQQQGNRKRRGRRRRGKGPQGPVVDQNTALPEDARTFWERSNVRLGFETDGNDDGRRKGRAPVEYPCAVCGTMMMLDRWPKHRHDARCDTCKQEISGLLREDPDDDASQDPRARPPGGASDGIPVMTPEDLEAVAQMRAAKAFENAGRTANTRRSRRRGGGQGGQNGEGGQRRRRRRGGGGGQNQNQNQNQNNGQSSSGGEGRRRRRRRRGGGGQGGGPRPNAPQNDG